VHLLDSAIAGFLLVAILALCIPSLEYAPEQKAYEIQLAESGLGDHPKAATYDQFKSGHSEGLRHTH
jgi:hypothetical protein